MKYVLNMIGVFLLHVLIGFTVTIILARVVVEFLEYLIPLVYK